MVYNNINITNLRIPVSNTHMYGVLTQPIHSKGVIIIAMGGRVNRHKIKGSLLQRRLLEENYSILSVDLLTPIEGKTYDKRFNLELNKDRLLSVISWVKKNFRTKDLPISIIGIENGALIALEASLKSENDIFLLVLKRVGIIEKIYHKESIKLPKTLVILTLEKENQWEMKLEELKSLNVSLEFIPDTTLSLEEDYDFVESVITNLR